MAYVDDVPAIENNQATRALLLAATPDVGLCFGPDSRFDYNSTTPSYMTGVLRTWPMPIVAVTSRGQELGGAFWLSGGATVGTSASLNFRRNDQTASGGETDLYPATYGDYSFSADRSGGSTFTESVFTHGPTAVKGDPFSGLLTYVRQMYYRGAATVVDSVVMRGLRNGGTDFAYVLNAVAGTDVTVTMTGTAGWQWADVSCGTGSGAPGIRIVESSLSVNETGKRMYIGHKTAYRGTAPGVRLAGLRVASMGTGGGTGLDMWRGLGGDGVNAYCTEANAAKFFEGAFWPNLFVIGSHQNTLNSLSSVASGEQAQLDVGTDTLFSTHVNGQINQIEKIYTDNGQPLPTFVLLNDYKTAWSDLNHQTRGRALLRIRRERGARFVFVDFFQRIVNPQLWMAEASPNGVHPSGPAIYNYPDAGGTHSEVGGSKAIGQGVDHLARELWYCLAEYVEPAKATYRNSGFGGGG